MIQKEDRKGLRTWIEVDTQKLDMNIRSIKKAIADDVLICATVKSNAYGHGLVDFSKAVTDKVDYLAVDSIVEGIRLRKEGIKNNIIVLGFTLPELHSKAVKNNIEITISSLEQLEHLVNNNFDTQIKVHIKIDTGMHRQGFMHEQKDELFKLLGENTDNIKIVGAYTHFADAKDPNDRERTETQIAEFESWKKDFYAHNLKPIFHSSATAATLLYPESQNDMVRIGIGLFGYYPSKQTQELVENDLELEPILSWRSIISEIKTINKGESLGYNFSWTANKDSVIAIVPIGYWHGLSRIHSNKIFLLIRGKKVPVVGMISMDMTIIDITDVPLAKTGDVITIIGESDGYSQYATDIVSGAENESYYETLTRINPLIKKFYV